MSSPSSLVYVLPKIIDVFVPGAYKIKYVESKPQPIEKLVSIYSPIEAGEYAVLVLLHGFGLYNFYSELSCHIASHGYIIVVPQLHELPSNMLETDATKDVESLVAVTNWLQPGLQELLPPKVNPNFNKLALAGHSRGGKVAFALALGKVNVDLKLKYRALIGIDPVDLTEEHKQTTPKVLSYKPHSFSFEIPVMVIGSGLGHRKKYTVFPTSAPKGVNHKDFYNECHKPACYFVAKDQGHLDMLDDDKGFPWFWIDKLLDFILEHGKSREPMRKFVGGAVVSFLIDFLNGDGRNHSYLKAVKDTKVLELEEFDHRLVLSRL